MYVFAKLKKIQVPSIKDLFIIYAHAFFKQGLGALKL